MITIRPAVIQDIKRELDLTAFTQHYFSVTSQQKDYLIKIEFKGEQNFYFLLKQVKHDKQPFITEESPGLLTLEPEKMQHENIQNARGRIYQWALRIEQDHKANVPGYSDLESLREEILKNITDSLNSDTASFTQNEKNIMFEKLNELSSQVEELYAEKTANGQQINIMRQQINKLKESVEILNKRTWLLSAVHRVFDIYKEVKASTNEIPALISDFNNLLPDNTEIEITEVVE